MSKIKWSISSQLIRTSVAELCGWITHKNKLSSTGRRIIKTEWENLSEAARNVLINHGIEK